MSTMEITCGRCEKSFRVRSEFAGRSTRCPACSASLTIGGVAPPSAPPPPPPPRRKKPDDDDIVLPKKLAADWRPVDAAFRNERTALIFLAVQLGFDLLAFCLAQMVRNFTRMDIGVAIFFLLICLGPTIGAAVMGISARISASRAPERTQVRVVARTSLFLCFGSLALMIFGAVAIPMLERSGGPPTTTLVCLFAAIFGVILAIATMLGLISQIGMSIKSKAIGASISGIGLTATWCLVVVTAISLMIAFFHDVSTSGFGYYRREPEGLMIGLAIMIPISLMIIGSSYFRLLGVARKELTLATYEQVLKNED